MRVRQVITLAAGLTLLATGVAHAAGAGDDAHFVVQQRDAPNAGVPTSNVVSCPIGERALSGGVRYFSNPKDIPLRSDGPLSATGGFLDDGGAPAQWQTAVQNVGSSTVKMISYAICSASTDATNVHAVRFTVAQDANNFPTGRAVATCPSGQRAIGGGIVPDNVNSGAFIMADGPVDETSSPSSTSDDDVARGWLGAARGQEGDGYRVYVICSATSTATVQVESLTQAPNTGGVTGLTCPTGQRALSGGIIDDAAYAWIVQSAPGGPGSWASSATPGIASGWRGAVWSIVGSNVLFKVAAVCEAPSPTNPNPPPPVDPGEPAPPADPNPPADTVSNNFTIGRFYKDKDKGRGAIVLHVPGPGTVTIESSKLKDQLNVAAKAKDIGLSVLAADGTPRQKLVRTGKLKTKAKLTFLPDGGSPSTQKTKLKLIYAG